MALLFADKVVIVTGSSAGLGEAFAQTFASRGARVTITGRNQNRLLSVLQKLVNTSGGRHDKFLAVVGDLNDPRVRKDVIDKTIEKFGRLDVLVANAGVIGTFGPLIDETEDNFDYIMNTNLKSVFFLIQLAVNHLEKTRGNVINISSIASSIVAPSAVVYSMSKVALDHLTRCLAVELGPRGIRVNTVNPGYFQTLIFRDMGSHFEKQLETTERKSKPLKGRDGVLEDVAETVSFLTSDKAGFITGESIRVNGGRCFVSFNDESPIL